MRLSRPMPRAISWTLAPTLFAQARDLVDEGDLGGEKGVGRIFGEFRGAPVGDEDRRLIEIERPVDFAHHRLGALILQAEDNAVRPLEIGDRRALAQEFGVRDDGEIGVRPRLADNPLDLVARADRHGGFGHDHREALDRRGDLARRLIDIGEVRMAIAAPRRRADGDEDRLRAAHRREIVGKGQPVLPHIGHHQFGKAGLVDRHFAGLQRLDLPGILVDAADLVPEVRKTGARNEAHITRANHRDLHFPLLKRQTDKS